MALTDSSHSLRLGTPHLSFSHLSNPVDNNPHLRGRLREVNELTFVEALDKRLRIITVVMHGNNS